MKSTSFSSRTAIASALFFAASWAMGSTPLQCSSNENQPISILAVGNSLTIHAPLPAIGWQGNWGMAANAEAKDYVAQFSSKLSNATSCKASATRASFAAFERSFWQDNTAAARQNIINAANRANIIVVQLSDNVSDSDFTTYEFQRHYTSLLMDLAAAAPAATMLCIGPWWANQAKEAAVIKSCKTAAGIPVSISDLRGIAENRATAGNQNPGVAAHPSDAGMAAIANRLIDALRAAKKVR